MASSFITHWCTHASTLLSFILSTLILFPDLPISPRSCSQTMTEKVSGTKKPFTWLFWWTSQKLWLQCCCRSQDNFGGNMKSLLSIIQNFLYLSTLLFSFMSFQFSYHSDSAYKSPHRTEVMFFRCLAEACFIWMKSLQEVLVLDSSVYNIIRDYLMQWKTVEVQSVNIDSCVFTSTASTVVLMYCTSPNSLH